MYSIHLHRLQQTNKHDRTKTTPAFQNSKDGDILEQSFSSEVTPEVVAVAERSDTVINETGCHVKVLASRVDVINVTMTLAFARHK